MLKEDVEILIIEDTGFMRKNIVDFLVKNGFSASNLWEVEDGMKAIDKLKEKYRIIRDQKIRERVEALGVEIQGNEDRETLLQKERDYKIARQKIELSLESFYRSASSLVFQLNKRHITRHMSIFRCIDQRFETGEIFIKWDEAPDEEWLLLIYIKNNSPEEGIVIEDKANQEKNIYHEFKAIE